jgi:hypothetical protein
MSAGPGWRIEQELEELPPVTLDDVKARARGFLKKYGDDYGEDYKRLLAQVRTAKSVAKLHEVLGLDWFIAY